MKGRERKIERKEGGGVDEGKVRVRGEKEGMKEGREG